MSPRVAEPAAFDISGPLPAGVTVLEASAGTGKTYTIAALAARYVAEGTPLDQILLVTFTRMATGELRDRVRERLVHTEQGLARRLAGAPPSDADEVVALLASGPEDEVRERHGRLARALARFDAATIATTHGFCQEVLGGLGIVGDVETDMTFVEDPADLVEEVVDDLFVRRFHRHGEPQFSRAEALRIARIAVANPAARIEPDGGAGEQRRGDARALRARRLRGVRAAQAAHVAHHVRGSADAAEGHARRARAARPRRSGCARATGSCWSTSSRTPIPSSGTSCASRSGAAASRSC